MTEVLRAQDVTPPVIFVSDAIETGGDLPVDDEVDQVETEIGDPVEDETNLIAIPILQNIPNPSTPPNTPIPTPPNDPISNSDFPANTTLDPELLSRLLRPFETRNENSPLF